MITTTPIKLLQPYELKLTLHKLKALNEVWNYHDMFRLPLGELEAAFPSIMFQVSKKLMQKQTTKIFNPGKKEQFTVKLLPYEAKCLEKYIRGVQMNMPYGYEKTIADKTADEIHQYFA